MRVFLPHRLAEAWRQVLEPCQWWNCKEARESRSTMSQQTSVVIRSSPIFPRVVLRCTLAGCATAFDSTNQHMPPRGNHRNVQPIPLQRLHSQNSLEYRRERTYRHFPDV